jgi:hypothetical protein
LEAVVIVCLAQPDSASTSDYSLVARRRYLPAPKRHDDPILATEFRLRRRHSISVAHGSAVSVNWSEPLSQVRS